MVPGKVRISSQHTCGGTMNGSVVLAKTNPVGLLYLCGGGEVNLHSSNFPSAAAAESPDCHNTSHLLLQCC